MLTSSDLAHLRTLFHHLDLHDRGAAAQLVADARLDAPAVLALVRGEVPSGDAGPLDELESTTLGWSCYYSAQYDRAASAFAVAWRSHGPWQAWAALGLGKVASDLGRWDEAQSWLLVALDASRRDNDLFRMAECLGALGEVRLRAGDNRSAFELFTTDAALLPPGSGHALRLQNYTAIALGRMGHLDLAAPLLWEGFFTALLRDPVSAMYSLASLAALAVNAGDPKLQARVDAVAHEHNERLGSASALYTEMPRGFLAVCRAARAHANGNTDAMRRELQVADRAFCDRYPVERAWVSEISGADTDGWDSLLARTLPLAPPSGDGSPVDLWLRDTPLPPLTPHRHAFAKLRESARGARPFEGLVTFFV